MNPLDAASARRKLKSEVVSLFAMTVRMLNAIFAAKELKSKIRLRNQRKPKTLRMQKKPLKRKKSPKRKKPNPLNTSMDHSLRSPS